MTVIPLPWTDTPPLTQNGLRRMHHHAEGKAKKAALEAARWAIRAAKPPRLIGCDVHLHWRMPDRRRRDADSAAPTLKVALDALVAEGVLEDDSWPYVPTCGVVTHPPDDRPGALWLVLSNETERP